MLKRGLDILLSVLGIIIVLPFIPLLALLIKLDSKGPVFFACDRVGKDHKLFKMYKFRTMYETSTRIGPSVSPAGDARVTPLGRFLRRTKLNELPQFLNVLRGEMSFVGPRPEAPDLAALYPEHAHAIFTVKPGLVGPNQILGRNEEEWYPPGFDPQQYYIEAILPKKLPVDLEYVRQLSAFSDLKYILFGVKETLFKALNWNLVLQNTSQIYLLLTDLALSLVSFTLAHVLRFADLPQGESFSPFLKLLPIVVIVRLPCFVYCGLYGTLIRYLSFHDIVSVIKGVSAGSVLFVSLTFLVDFRKFSRLVFLFDWICLIFLMSAMRSALRFYWEKQDNSLEKKRRRVLIFGAGDAGVLAYRFLMAEKEPAFEIVGFLDDDPTKRNKSLYGKRVLGDRYTLGTVVNLYRISDILLAIPSAPSYEIAKVIQACQQAGVRVRVFPTLKDTPMAPSALREISLAELFETQNIEIDLATVQRCLQGKRVLLTSACGELGVELCRQILRCAPQKLIIIDRYEAYLRELVARLVNMFPDDQVVPVLCSPTSNGKITEVFLKHQPHVVFHTAMRKYLPFFDIQAEDVIRVNYLSTFEFAKQATRIGCEYFVMISSEEAVKRGNVVSDTLRAAEISLRQFFAAQQTSLVTVRLCDILENRGGIVAILEDQILHRELVTLPHPDVTCHFLSKRAAANFILESLALAETTSAEEGIFVYNNSVPVSLLEVATRLAMLHGVQLNSDLSIKYLHRNTQNGALAAHTHDHKRLVATAHARIGLLREPPLPDSPEFSAAIRHLLGLQEQHLAHAAWEMATHTLLRLESVA